MVCTPLARRASGSTEELAPSDLLVYTGHGTFVTEAGIWEGRELRPGAALQVWGSREEFERLQEGEDIHPYGTAAVFVRYTEDGVEVLHFNREETWNQTDYEVWIGANLKAREPVVPTR